MSHNIQKLVRCNMGVLVMKRLSEKTRIPFCMCMCVVLAGASFCSAKNSNSASFWERETLTNGYGGLADELADQGVEVSTSVTEIYQEVLDNGTLNQSTGHHSGSYDLELTFDLDHLLGIKHGTLYVHGEGSWPRNDLDTIAVGSVSAINADAASNRDLDITEVWYEQAFYDETLRLRFGKLDITGGFECRGCAVSFDGSAFANDETAQFLTGSLVNNLTIPFPDKGLGAVLYWNPTDMWYASIGAADATADARETGFATAFHGSDSHFFYVFETGITPQFSSPNGKLQGAYRIGVWSDPRAKGYTGAPEETKNDTGFYLSCDQMLLKESDNEDDSQGLGGFLRYGSASEKRNDIKSFWSAGLQYQGVFAGRDDDVLALGTSQAIFSDLASGTYSADNETVIEAYYSAQVTPWLTISPNLQHVRHPGGDQSIAGTYIAGIRAQMAF
jgi:porin